MSVSLSNLIDRLKADVPNRDGIPNGSQYERAVKTAVADFSRRCLMRKRAALSIVSGTATYVLPNDFVKIIESDDITLRDDKVLVTDSGIVPLSDNFPERHNIANGQITFYPTPSYTTTRYLWYGAGYVLDESNIYQDMTDEIAEVVLLKAQALALRLQGNVTSSSVKSYKDGDVQVDFGNRQQSNQSQIKDLTDEYEKQIDQMIGSVIMQTKWETGYKC